jgi:CheY-like chemotaxis protein
MDHSPQIKPEDGERILVVEDSDTIRSLVREILSQSGYSVLCAEGPEEALEACERFGHSIRLLVTDVVMPCMTGIELADRLAQKFPSMKVIYISGYTGDTVIDEGELASRGAFLQKPFSPVALVDTVSSLLGG